jgi:MFS family permease
MSNTIPRRFAGFFGLNASMAAMVVMVVVIGLGEKMAERFLPLYIMALGGSALAVGSVNALDNLLGALYSFPGGYISDRIGHKKALMIFTLVAMFGYGIVLAFTTWWAVLVGSVFFIAWTAVSLPAVMSLVAKSVPKDKRAMGVTVHSLTRRIPMALGPICGGLFIAAYGVVKGIRVAFLFALGLGAVSLLVQWVFMKDDPPAQKSGAAGPLKLLKNFSPPLRNLLIADILIRFAEQMPYAFVVIWVVNNLRFSAFQFGILTVVEMATAMLIYIPVAYFADKHTKKPFIVTTFMFFTIFPMAVYFSRSFPLLIAAFVIRGLKEFGEPTRKSLIMDLAPEECRAGMFGAYYLIRDIIVAVAAFGGAFLWGISPLTNFAVASACGLAGTLWFAFFGKDLKAVECGPA